MTRCLKLAFFLAVLSMIQTGCGSRSSETTSEPSASEPNPADIIVGKWKHENGKIIEFTESGAFVSEPGFGGVWAYSPKGTWYAIQEAQDTLNEITIDGDQLERTTILGETSRENTFVYVRMAN